VRRQTTPDLKGRSEQRHAMVAKGVSCEAQADELAMSVVHGLCDDLSELEVLSPLAKATHTSAPVVPMKA
jgi:hypothetical protein